MTNDAVWMDPPSFGYGPPINTVKDQPVFKLSSSQTAFKI